jgi:hypothetical protein
VWVVHATTPGTVAKLRADTGAPAPGSPFPTGDNGPFDVAFDGTHVWVTHQTSPSSVAKLPLVP